MNPDHDDQHDELARRLQTVMRDHDREAPAPGSIDLTDGRAISSARTGSSRRLLVGGLAAAAVVAAAALTVALPGHHSTTESAGTSPSSAPTAPSPISAPTIPRVTFTAPSGRTIIIGGSGDISFYPVQFRGLRLFYPDLGFGPCGDVHGVGYQLYDAGRSAKHFTDCDGAGLVFAATDGARTIDSTPAKEDTTVGGVPARTGTKDGFTYIVVPSLKVVARFSTGAANRNADVLHSASIVTRDDYGCPLHIDDATMPRSTVPGTADQMVPGKPVSVLDCRYTGSDLLTPGMPTDITHPVTATQQALNQLDSSATSCAPYTDRDRHVLFRYADGSVLDVRVRPTKCDRDVIYSNGSLTRVGDNATVPLPV